MNKDNIFEKRRFVRITARFVFSYRDITTQESKRDVTQTKNISIGGILFTTNREYPKGAILRGKLKLPDISNHINLKVKVVGSRLKKESNIIYENRAEFISIKKEDKDAIRKIVEYHLLRGDYSEKQD